VQCARRTQLTFAQGGGTGEHRAAVVRICQMVEGMPLAIELAAAWLKGMSPQQIVGELERGLDILTARFQNIPARHRSIRAVLDYSWSLLQAEEREVVQRLSVFLGSFHPEAAAEVAGASLLTLAVLVEKALVRMTPDQRYQIHELTRQYAAEHVTSSARAALRDVHATYYAALLQQQRPHLFTAAYKKVFTIVADEFGNIFHAWQWIIDAIGQAHTGLPITTLLRQMTEVFATYHFSRSLYLSGQALFRHALDVMEKAGWGADATPPDQQATFVLLQLYTGLFHFEMGQFKISLDLAEGALDRCRALNIEHDLALALLLYGRTQVRRGVHPAAITALQEALALYRRLGSTSGYAEALIGLGISASQQGHYAQAQLYFQELLTLGQEAAYQPWVVRALTSLGTIHARQQNHQHARPYYEQALAIAQAEGNQNYIMINTSNLGSVQRGLGRHRLSESYYKESLTLARSLSNKRWIAANLNGIAITYLEMGDLNAAERALREAITVAHHNESTPDTLGSIALLGHALARRGQVETALRVLTFAEQHPATMARDRLYNEPLLAELRSELPATLFDAASAWVIGQSVDELVRWLQQQGEVSVDLALSI
jgi:tetratricopeptide (TPR) repeat protein